MPAPSLAELEAAFVRHVRGDADDVALGAVRGAGLAPAARLAIYRNNLALNAADALGAVFPAVARLVGAEFMDGAARRFARERPAGSGNLQDYGAGFPDFLAAMPELETLPFVAEVGRLEWLRQEALLAADAPVLAPEALAGADATTRLALHPGARLIASAYPVLSIWRYSLAPVPDEPPAADGGAERALVVRSDAAVLVLPLAAGDYAFLAACRDGAALSAALEAGGRAEPGFDAGACLQRHFAAGVFAAAGEHTEHP